VSPLLRPEQRQHVVARGYRALSAFVGRGPARQVARLHPALDDEAAYQAWLDTQKHLALDSAASAPLRSRPLISVVMPVFDAPERFLREAIGSLREQSYPEWELCAADAGPFGSPGSRFLQACALNDGRVRIVSVGGNRGIAGNSNAALHEARGEFVAFLDQDDLLARSALAELVTRLEPELDLDLVYSDKDNVTPWGERYAPYFKPDWSPELFLSSNFVTHLCLVRRSLVDAAGGFDDSMDGAQDWDLLLRITEVAKRIAHVPRVLYHWRSLATSCAASLDAKPYAREAQRRAVQAHLDRRGVTGRVRVEPDGLVRIVSTASRLPPLSVVVREPCDVPGADAYGEVEIVSDAANALGELLLFWDPGTKPVTDGAWLRELALWAMQPVIGAAGPLVRGPDTAGSANLVPQRPGAGERRADDAPRYLREARRHARGSAGLRLPITSRRAAQHCRPDRPDDEEALPRTADRARDRQ
jgi:hypothetical protein